jgi:SAM-dependent methyltransferase
LVSRAVPPSGIGGEVTPCACGADSYRVAISGTYDRGRRPGLRFRVIECERCGLRRGWPMPSPLIYESGDAHSSSRPLDSTTWGDAIVADVRSLVPAGRFLDVGCNNGHVVAAALAAGYDAEGIDIDAAAVAVGAAAGLPVRIARLEDVDGSYDAVLLNHVLEHVFDLPTTLASIARVLAPHGLCFVYVPNHRGLVARLMGERWSGWLPDEHVWHFDAPSFRSVVAASPLEIRRLTTRGVIEPVEGNRPLLKRLVIGLSRSIAWGDQIEAVLARAA